MGKLANFVKNLNSIQRVIVGIIAPIIVFILGVAIAEEVDGHNAFDMDDTWFVWLLSVFFIGYIEYKLFDKSLY